MGRQRGARANLGPVNVDRAADRDELHEGDLPLVRLPRIVALDVEAGGTGEVEEAARYSLRFGRDEQGRAVVAGSVVARLPAVCQRCLELMQQPVSAEVQVVLLPAGAVPSRDLDDQDWVEVEREALNLEDFIEEELLLAMPVIPRHPEGECEPVAIPAGT